MDVEVIQGQPQQEEVQQQASVSITFSGTIVDSEDMFRAEGPV